MIHSKDDPKSQEELLQEASATEKKTPRILLAEDDDALRGLLAEVLSGDGYEVIQCDSGVEVLKCLQSFLICDECSVDFDVIISDVRMPGLTGLEILEDMHECKGFPPVILITAFGDDWTHMRAKKFGAVAILDKPFDINVLLSKVHGIVMPWMSSKK